MKALVVGYGSIGQRHARVLEELGFEVAVVSRRPVEHPRRYDCLDTALSGWRPEYVVIASRTSEHFDDLGALVAAGFAGRVLVEKPLFDVVRQLPSHRFSHLAVAYNMRFHPLILKLRDFLGRQEHLIAAHIYVGQYLPEWRPSSDYRSSYSASRNQGGGVLRDLSHEIDYALWLFGGWQQITALGGHFSALEIDSDDVYSLLWSTAQCPAVTVNLNYLDRSVRREILVITDGHSVRVDLIKGHFEIDGKQESFLLERDQAYQAEHNAMIAGDLSILCSPEEGMEVMATIAAAEGAARERTWVSR
jgi:predicted dehydrogenase